MKRSGLWLFIFLVKENTDKLADLGFIHKESFHWYNKLPSSQLLEFFINMYSLHMYRFC